MSGRVRIAVLGSGNIGGTLGARWLAAGHQVVFGARDPSSAKTRSALAKAGPSAGVEIIGRAVQDVDVVLVAIPNAAVAETATALGAALNGKIVIDATNRFGAPVVSHVATLAAAAPQALIYRAFNSLGWENFEVPVIAGQQVDLFYCGPEGESKAIMEQLIVDVGLRPVYVGGLDRTPLVDAVGSLWWALVFGQHHPRRLAFKLMEE
jgi:predicted dinucleotide-binding enzyme